MRSQLQELADQIRSVQEQLDAGNVEVEKLEVAYDEALGVARQAKVALAKKEVELIALEGRMEDLRDTLRSIANAS